MAYLVEESSSNELDAKAKGYFFAVDSRTWAKLCVPGWMNEAIAYLVQARGTGRDNRTTTWSKQAVETYTGISRHRAAAAIKKLQSGGFSRLLRGGTKPKYELVPFSEIPNTDPRPVLSFSERTAVEWVAKGVPLDRTDRKHARSAAGKGWLTESDGEFVIAPAPDLSPDLIWLPNAIVTGAASEASPVELLRQTQDPMALRLFIDMYQAQNLREDGGVSRQCIWQEYERRKIGERAQFTVWGFRYKSPWIRWENALTRPHRRERLTDAEKAAGQNPGVDLFPRLAQLGELGLIEWVPHLVESADETGEIIHPLGMGSSDTIENRLGRGALQAGHALVTEGQYGWAVENGFSWLVPVPRHVGNVQLVGIARLRYRPHTSMTDAWWANLNANAEKHLARYAEIASRQNTQAAA